MYYRFLMVFVSLIAFAPVMAKAADPPTMMGPPIGPDKKLIKWGADCPNSTQLRKNIIEMEKWPFDGVVINGDIVVEGERAWLHGQWFSTRKFKYEELRHIVDDFRATSFTKFTDNFMVMSQHIDDFVFKDEHGKEVRRQSLDPPDWFNDDEFAIVAANWALAARICKEAGMKGFMLDLEQWATVRGKYPRAWDYAFCWQHNKGNIPSFADCYAKSRERGKQLMAAVCSEFPDIVIINYIGGQKGSYDTIGRKPQTDPAGDPLATSDHALMAPFLDGMLEGIPKGSGATIVDGGPMYHANLNKRFVDYREHNYGGSRKMSKVPKLFDEHMKLGFAVWVDGRGWRTKSDWSWPWVQTAPYHANQFTPRELEHAYYFAMLNADKYVWVWSERATFFADSGYRWPGPITVSDDYLQALNRVREPHSMNFKRDDRGALTDPPAPIASRQPGYTDDHSLRQAFRAFVYHPPIRV